MIHTSPSLRSHPNVSTAFTFAPLQSTYNTTTFNATTHTNRFGIQLSSMLPNSFNHINHTSTVDDSIAHDNDDCKPQFNNNQHNTPHYNEQQNVMKLYEERLLAVRLRLHLQEQHSQQLHQQLIQQQHHNQQHQLTISELNQRCESLQLKLSSAEEFLQRYEQQQSLNHTLNHSSSSHHSTVLSSTNGIHTDDQPMFNSIAETQSYYKQLLTGIRQAHSEEISHILQYKLLFASVSAKREDTETQLNEERQRVVALSKQLQLQQERTELAEEQVTVLSAQCAQLAQKLIKLGYSVKLEPISSLQTTPTTSPKKSTNET